MLPDFVIANDNFLELSFKEINKLTPIRMSKDLVFQNAEKNDKGLIMNIHLVTYDKKRFDIKKIEESSQKQVLSNVCNDDVAKAVLERGYILEYVYTDKNDELMTTVEIKKGACS